MRISNWHLLSGTASLPAWENKDFIQKENELSLTGLVDSPVNLDPQEDAQTGTIVIEFNPLGAYRFFHFSFRHVKNQIVELSDLIGNRAEDLQLQLTEAATLDLKLQFLQNFLIKQLEKAVPDPDIRFLHQSHIAVQRPDHRTTA